MIGALGNRAKTAVVAVLVFLAACSALLPTVSDAAVQGRRSSRTPKDGTTAAACNVEPAPGAAHVPGDCVELKDCPELLPLLVGPNRNITHLRRTLCQIAGSLSYHCCPRPATSTSPTPTAVPSTDVTTMPVTSITASPDVNIQQAPTNHPLFPDPSRGECGIYLLQDKIFGGEKAELGSNPWMALLFYRLTTTDIALLALTKRDLPLCGGSIISSKFVLTAAHCLEPDDRRLAYVRIGDNDLRSDPDCDAFGWCAPPALNVTVSRMIVHQEYEVKPTPRNDIALLLLSAPVDFLKLNALPVCLPFASFLGSKPEGMMSWAGQNATVAGWGRTENTDEINEERLDQGLELALGSDVLLQVSVPVLRNEDCRKLGSYKDRKLGPEHLCAGGRVMKDSCNGDSGGPLVVLKTMANKNQVHFQIGVVSFGPRLCGRRQVPGVYANVTHYLGWIESMVEANSEK